MTNATTAENDLDREATRFTADVKRGARRVRSAVEDGAEVVADAIRPTFGEQLGDVLRSVGKDPASMPGLVRDLVTDHPIASLAAVAVAAALVGRIFAIGRR
jgi:hypothetical protein